MFTSMICNIEYHQFEGEILKTLAEKINNIAWSKQNEDQIPAYFLKNSKITITLGIKTLILTTIK